MLQILVFFDSVFHGLSSVGLELLEFLNSYPELAGVRLIDYTFGDILFGVGLPTYFLFSAIKYIKDIVI